MTKESLEQPRFLTVVLPADYDNAYLWDLIDMASSAGFELKLQLPPVPPRNYATGGILPNVYGGGTTIMNTSHS